jgi:glycine/D-amino acid oxidase-like deaminating enzyme
MASQCFKELIDKGLKPSYYSQKVICWLCGVTYVVSRKENRYKLGGMDEPEFFRLAELPCPTQSVTYNPPEKSE